MGRFTVKLGGVYDTEPVPGTVADPDDTPSAVTWLDAVFLSVGTNGHLGELRCISNKQAEDFDASITRGQWIQVTDAGFGGTSSSSSGSGGTVIFDGVVVNEHIVIAGTEVATYLVAFDHGSYLLHRTALHGQYRRSYAKEVAYFGAGAGSTSSVRIDTDILQIDTPICFNPDGQPNMTDQTFYNADAGTSSQTFHIFEAPFRDQFGSGGQELVAQYWTLQDAVSYLLNTNNTTWAIDNTSFTDTKLTAAFGANNPQVSNINVEGKTLSQALTDLLAPHNYGYWVDTKLDASHNLQEIHFFFKGDGSGGNSATVDLAPRLTLAGVSEANLIHGDFLFDNGSTVNRLEGYGDRVCFTTLANFNGSSSSSGGTPPKSLTLVKGWKDSDLVYPSNDSGTSPQPNWWDNKFRQDYCNQNLLTAGANSGVDSGIFGVGRQWLVNQGEIATATLENLSADLLGGGSSSSSGGGSSSSSGGGSPVTALTGYNSFDPRRLEKPQLYVTNRDGGLLHQEEIVVEMSVDSGSTFKIVDKSFYRILPESMGIVFVQPSLELLGIDITGGSSGSSSSSSGNGYGKNYWQALKDGTLRLRILCSVRSDERVRTVINNDGSAFPLAIGGVFNNQGFKRNVYNSAINSTVYYTQYPPATLDQDDTPALQEVVATQLRNTNRATISGAARVLLEDFDDYTPGMVITGIDNRDIDFSIGTGDGPTILQLLYKFQEQQLEMTLDNHRVASIVGRKPLNNAQNQNQHKLGIENPVPLQGGNQVPQLPMADPDSQLREMMKRLERGG